MSRSLEYLVGQLLSRLNVYFYDPSATPEPIEALIAEVKSVLSGGESSKFEQWFVSTRGKVIHLLYSETSDNKTLCRRTIHKDGIQVFLKPGSYGYEPCMHCWNIFNKIDS